MAGVCVYAFGASNFYGDHVPFWIMLVIGLGVAAVFGLLLGAPTLRLRGDYLAIVTLGFGEIVPIVFKNGGRPGRGGVNGIRATLTRPRSWATTSSRRSES